MKTALKLSSQNINLFALSAAVFAMAAFRAIYSGSLTNLFVYWNVFLALAAFLFIKAFNLVNAKTGLSKTVKNLGLGLAFAGPPSP